MAAYDYPHVSNDTRFHCSIPHTYLECL